MTENVDRPMKVAVLAGERRQYDEWKRENRAGDEYVYVGTERDAIGVRFSGHVVVGTFWRRPDARPLHDLVLRRTLSGPGCQP